MDSVRADTQRVNLSYHRDVFALCRSCKVLLLCLRFSVNVKQCWRRNMKRSLKEWVSHCLDARSAVLLIDSSATKFIVLIYTICKNHDAQRCITQVPFVANDVDRLQPCVRRYDLSTRWRAYLFIEKLLFLPVCTSCQIVSVMHGVLPRNWYQITQVQKTTFSMPSKS